MNFIVVAIGGGLGAALRYAISLLPYRGVFPLLTLVTNLIGAFAIGFIVGIVENRGMSARALLFLKTGVCGGFTTFSTFSLEALSLIEGQHIGIGITYIVLSAAVCIVGVLCGRTLALHI